MFEIVVNISFKIFSYAYGLPSYHISHTYLQWFVYFLHQIADTTKFLHSAILFFYILQHIILTKLV